MSSDRLRIALWAAALAVVISVGVRAAPPGGEATAAGVPDIYIEEGNSLVLTVPDLTRVAVGNGTIVMATIVGPNEVLLQALPTGGALRFTHVYVWSGNRRYIYRAVAVPTFGANPQAPPLPQGVIKIETKPDRLVFHGPAPEEAAEMFRRYGWKVETRVVVPSDTEGAGAQIVREGMTEKEVERILGKPLSRRVFRSTEGFAVTRNEYSNTVVDFLQGRVVAVTQIRPDAPEALGIPHVEAGQISYRFRYAEPAEVMYLLRILFPELEVAADAPSRSIFLRRSPAAEAAVEIIRRLDEPVFTGGISVIRATSDIAILGSNVAGGEFAILQLSPAMRFTERLRFVQGLMALEEKLTTTVPGRIEEATDGTEVTTESFEIQHVIPGENLILLRGDKGFIDVMVGYAMAEGVGIKPADIEAAARSGRLLRGMPRTMVEEVLGEPKTPPRPRESSDGRVLWEVSYGGVTVLYHRDVLVGYWNASDALRPGLSPSEVERLLGAPREIREMEGGAVEMTYAGGRATYLDGRLALFRAEGALPEDVTVSPALSEPLFVLTEEERLAREEIQALSDAEEEVTAVFRLRSRQASEIAAVLGDLIAAGDSTEIRFVVDGPTNTLLAIGKPERVREARRYVEELDQQSTQQVLIEAKFVELTRGALKRLGVSWGLGTTNADGNQPFVVFGGPASTTDGGFASPSPSVPSPRPTVSSGGVTIQQTADNPGILFGVLNAGTGKFSNLNLQNLDVVISALEDENLAEVLSAPRVVAVNNKKATLESVDRVFDVTFSRSTEVTAGGLATTNVTAVPTEKKVGITLDVTPTIGRDGIITLDIGAKVSRVESLFSLDDASGNPIVRLNVISERNATSRVMVRSGTTLAIGGLLSEQKREAQSGVPVLSKIPILGRLFRTDSDLQTSVDLVIFLTARIVPTDGTVASVDLASLPPASAELGGSSAGDVHAGE